MEITGVIKADKRTDLSSGATKRLRKAGYLPGNIYGKNMDSISVTVKKDELRKNIVKLGRAAVFKLDTEGEEIFNVMVKDIQIAPLSGDFLHVDFIQISLTEEIKADVVIRIIGREHLEAKRYLLNRAMDTILVKGLPQDIPNEIDIDVSNMEVGDSKNIGDIQFPEGIVPEIEPDQLVLSVSEAKAYEEETTEGEEEAESISQVIEDAEEGEEA
ncbi:MAG: 50S ribosomal protein L25 [Eubacteriales bacterium]|nr:50S ribosomal protein L25 [Eubacteriales bacterium]